VPPDEEEHLTKQSRRKAQSIDSYSSARRDGSGTCPPPAQRNRLLVIDLLKKKHVYNFLNNRSCLKTFLKV
jgi:hypothetical protein